jgi:hypothetical protein
MINMIFSEILYHEHRIYLSRGAMLHPVQVTAWTLRPDIVGIKRIETGFTLGQKVTTMNRGIVANIATGDALAHPIIICLFQPS